MKRRGEYTFVQLETRNIDAFDEPEKKEKERESRSRNVWRVKERGGVKRSERRGTTINVGCKCGPMLYYCNFI